MQRGEDQKRIVEILQGDAVPVPLDPITGRPVVRSGDFSIGGDLWPGLSKLIEECGEVMQVGGKLIGSEGRTDHWSGDLNAMLIEELGDLRAEMAFFIEANGIDTASVSQRQRQKLERFWTWHRDTQAARNSEAPQ